MNFRKIQYISNWDNTSKPKIMLNIHINFDNVLKYRCPMVDENTLRLIITYVNGSKETYYVESSDVVDQLP